MRAFVYIPAFLYALLAILLFIYLLPPVFVLVGLDVFTVTVIYSLSCLGVILGTISIIEGRKEGAFEFVISAIGWVQSIEYYLQMYKQVVAILSGMGLFTIIGGVLSWVMHRRQTKHIAGKIDKLGISLGKKLDSMNETLKGMKGLLQKIHEALTKE